MRRTRSKAPEDKSKMFQVMARGNLIRGMLSSNAWREYVAPFLDEYDKEIMESDHFKPGQDIPSIERLALLSAFNGGRREAISAIKNQIHEWEQAGAEENARWQKSKQEAGNEKQKS